MDIVSTRKIHGDALLGAKELRVVYQSGTIDGITTDAIGIPELVVNIGLIENTAFDGIAVDLKRGGIVLNAALIQASGAGGIGVRIVSGAVGGSGAAVVNSGTVGGVLNGIELPVGGLVANTSGGLIESSSRYGIDVSGGAGTVVDAGTISGGTDAIRFAGDFADRVILERGAVLDGKVVGGSGSSTLELDSGLGGTGTLSAFTGEFENFSTLTVDAGARWTLARGARVGTDIKVTDAGALTNLGTIASTVTVPTGGNLSNLGSIFGPDAGVVGVSIMSDGVLVNDGVIAGGAGAYSRGTASYGTMYGRGGIGVTDADADITNAGTILGGQGGNSRDPTGSGGVGGVGMTLAGGTLDNFGTITGGAGGAGEGLLTSGGVGGIGVDITRVVAQPAAIVLDNDGVIAGGEGGSAQAEDVAGAGGIGVMLAVFDTLTNSGTINGGNSVYPAGPGGTGVLLQSGGLLDNTGRIAGGSGGSAFYRFAIGAGGNGVDLQAVGSVENSGTIAGGSGGYAGFYYGGDGIDLHAGGSVANAAGALVLGAGFTGIAFSGGAGTVTDAGTISSGANIFYPGQFFDAITFSGSFADRVILDPGAVLNGQVIGGTGTNTLELAASSLGNTGTVSSFGTEFTSFGTISLDAGASWLLDGASPDGQAVVLINGSHVLSLNDTAGFADPVSGFASTDALDLRDVAYAAGATATLSGSFLTVSSGAVTDTLTLLGLSAGTTFGVGNDGEDHVLIHETVSSTGGHNDTASTCYVVGANAAPAFSVFSAQASHAAMSEALRTFLRPPIAAGFWSRDAANGFHAPLHAISSITSFAATDQSDRSGTHSAWLHHVIS